MKLAAPILLAEERSQRRRLRLPGTVRDVLGAPQDVLVQDLSESGFCANLETELPIGARVRLGTTALRLTDARVVWKDGPRHGFVFDREISQNDVMSASHADNVVRPSLDFAGSNMRVGPALDIEPHMEKYPRAVRAAIAIIPAALFWGFVISRIY